MMESSPNLDRWYDQDPALSKAIASLKDSPTGYHAQVALNIINIIVEHHAHHDGVDTFELEELLMDEANEKLRDVPKNRWYDVNTSLRSAMQLLQDTPREHQARIIPHIAEMIETTLERQLSNSN